MNRYTIYCTKSQTNKALVLGAPIERGHESSRYFNIGVPTFYDENDEICRVKNSVIFIPTAEQMIGWIESISTIQLQMEKQMHESNTQYRIWVRDECKPFSDIIEMRSYPSRKEATLAAIDAALEYLIKKEGKDEN